MMPEDALETLRGHDAVLLGAVGDPSVPDHVALWETILEIRQGLDLWANLRPCRLLPGDSDSARERRPEDVDFLVVRENTEGEYAGVGGRSHRGLDSEVALETSVFTRSGVAARRALRLRAGGFPSRDADERDEVERVAVRLRALGRGGGGDGGGVRQRPRRARAGGRARRAHGARSREASTSSSRRISSATSSPTSRRRSRAAWAWPRVRTSRPAPTCRASSSPCTARRRTSPGRGSPTPPARSGARRSCSSTWEADEAAAASWMPWKALATRARGRRDVGGEATTAEVGDAVAAPGQVTPWPARTLTRGSSRSTSQPRRRGRSTLRVDQILLEDATGTMACLQFERLGLDRVAVPRRSRTSTTTSCSSTTATPTTTSTSGASPSATGCSTRRRQRHLALPAPRALRAAGPGAARRGQPHDDGRRARHARHRRRGDRGGRRHGGQALRLERPLVVGVELRGDLQPWVQSKDVVLELLRRRGVRGGRGRDLRVLSGKASRACPATDRGTICNMVMETGATTGIFPCDARTQRVA